MKMRKLLAVLLCVCLLSGCPTVLATWTDGRMKLEFEMKNDGLSINGHIVNPNQTVTMGRDGQLHKSEEIDKLQEKLKQLGYFVNLVPFTGSDGKIHYQGGTNSVLDDLFSLLKNNIALFDGQKSIAVVNEPADITLTGNHGTLLVGPGARESTVTVQRGSIDNLVVVGGSVGVNIGGQVQNLYVSEDTTVNTMHRHYPGEQKKVNEIPATPTKGGQYTLITYCGDPTCGQQIDINTYQTDPLPLPETSDKSESGSSADPCANGHTFEVIAEGSFNCEEGGFEPRLKCSVCGLETGGNELPATGDHQYNYLGDGVYECSVCHFHKVDLN